MLLVVLATMVPVLAHATAPVVTTNPATLVAYTTATVNGTVDPKNRANTVTFQYGLTTGYGTTVNATPNTIAAGGPVTAVSAALTGLTCSTTYNFRAVSVNSDAVTVNGTNRTFATTACAAPTATTNAATSVAATAATLNGTVSSNGASTTVTFDYGIATNTYTFSATAAQSPLGNGAINTAVSAAVSGLTCNTTYYFRVKGVNSVGTTNGGELSFTTTACVPTATTSAATPVAATTATLNGTVASNGASTTVTFDYGTSISYGSTVTGTLSPVAAVSGSANSTAVSYAASGLTCNTTYHFRVNGVNSAGTTNGSDLSFTTTACAPTATTGAATSVAPTTATLNGTVSSNGAATTVTFEYGLSAGTYGAPVAATPSTVTAVSGSPNSTAVSYAVSGLTCNTTYYFRVKGVNSVGTTNGSELSFTTNACSATAPTVATSAATSVAATAATLNGTVSSNGASTTVTFDYGIATNTYTFSATAAQSPLGNGAINTAVSAAVSGLTCNTTYYFRVKGVNSVGTTNGGELSFTTTACVPTATTSAATPVAATTATLNGTVSSNGASTTVTFDYGTSISYGGTVTGTPSPVAAVPGSANSTAVSYAASGLTCNTTYHFRVNGVNSAGTTNGSDLSFTTTACAPTATTDAASGVGTDNGTAWSATLNGTVSSNGAETTVYFEYGTSTAYGVSATATLSPLPANGVNSPVLAVVDGFNCNTTFHYRVVAINGVGRTNGLDSTFSTLSCTAPPYGPTDCAATRFGKDLGCTANDVNLTNIALAPGSISSCVSGTPVTLDLDLTVHFASPDRWDVGIFIANDGKLPTLLPASGGASSCSVDILPITPQPSPYYQFPDLDGGPMGMADTCGDGNSSIGGGTGSGIKHMTGVTLPCYASAASGGQLFVPFAVSWDNQKSPIGGLCTSKDYPVPNTTSKCNAPLSSVSIAVVVLPKINKTHSGATFNPDDSITYSIVVFNDSGGTLQQSKLTDPVVGGLTVGDLATDVTCATANGSTCPTTTKALIQGTGIVINPTDLPNNSSLIFTVKGILTGSLGAVISNKATITMPGGSSKDSIDSVTLGAASGAKSFAPTSITEGASSLMTITFTNPTAVAVSSVSFTDTYPSGLVNAATPNPTTTCTGGVPGATGANTLTFSVAAIPANSSCAVSVYVTSSTANSYVNSVTFTPSSLGSTSATLTVSAGVYGGFNACDEATAPNAACTSATPTSYIKTKIAGSPIYLDVVSLNTNGSRKTNYSNNMIVDLLDSHDNGGALNGYGCRSTWTTVLATITTPTGPVSGLFSHVGPFTVANAYPNVRVRVTNSGGSTTIGCSTDAFAIRPSVLAGLNVSTLAQVVPLAWDLNWQTAGTTNMLNNTAAAGALVHKAGQYFTLSAAAYNAAGVITANYAGSPAMTLSNCSVSTLATNACTSSFGSFVPGVTSFAAGKLRSDLATYSEVGAFNLTLQDTNFAAVDAGDGTSPDCSSSGYYVCSVATPVGRFVPDHFLVAPGVVVNRQLAQCSVVPKLVSSFTYAGEEMQVSAFKLTAYNGLATPTITKNYSGDLAKFDGSVTDNFGFGAVDLADATAPIAAKAFVVGSGAGELGLVSSSGSWGTGVDAGVGTFTANLKLNRAATPDGPYESFRVGIAPVDADGVTILAADKNLDINVPADGADKVLIGSSIVRFGRLRLISGQGSELAPFKMQTEAQYWDGTYWRTNKEDSCTSYVSGNFGVPTGTTPGPATGIKQGYGSLLLTHPTIGKETICMGLVGSSSACTGSSPASLSYLLGNWGVATYDQDPWATVTFGGANSNSRGNWGFLYRRENF